MSVGRSFIVVQTGFSQGTPDISNDDELAAEVMGFLQQFLEVFEELKGSDFYVTGESVSGFPRRILYISWYLSMWRSVCWLL